jgi:molybdopterin-guanine dinucleotide biosynthesis protein A
MLVLAPHQPLPRGSDRCDRVVRDDEPGQGPLRGILTALRNATTSLLIVATVDMPMIAHDHLAWLADQLAARPDALGVFLTRDEIEPFPSAYRTTASAAIASQLEANRRAVRALTKLPGFVTLPVPANWPDETWTNLNKPEDLARFNDRQG